MDVWFASAVQHIDGTVTSKILKMLHTSKPVNREFTLYGTLFFYPALILVFRPAYFPVKDFSDRP